MNPITRWFERKRLDRELAAEMKEHLAERVEELMEAGESEQDAIASARRQFGNVTQQQEESREVWGWNGLEQIAQDARFAGRMLRKSPLLTVAAILTLTLGIGANTAIFTLIDKLLLRPLPVRDPERLVQLVEGKSESTIFGYIALPAIEQRSKTLEQLFTWSNTQLQSGWGADARVLSGAVASGNVYRALGLHAQIGRLFGPADDAPGAPAVAVLSDRYWESEFHRDPKVIGRKLTLERHPFTVIGVTPGDFQSVFAGAAPVITIPFRINSDLHPKWDMLHTRRMRWLSILGRLKPGVTMAAAQAELAVLTPQITEATTEPGAPIDPAEDRFFSVRSGATGTSWNSQEFRKALFVLVAVSGLVLLIACVNLANLLMARAAAREKELSVRVALGAGRGRLIRQLLTESLLLSSVGALLGIGFAWWGTALALKVLPVTLDPSPDWRVLSYLTGLAIATGILFGVVPAVRGTDLGANRGLKQARIGLERRTWSLGNGLVATQVALSAMLLLGALLFVRTLQNLKTEATGFSRENLGYIALDSERSGMNAKQLLHFYDDLLVKVRALPAVRAASLSSVVPLTGSWIGFTLDAKQSPHLSQAERTICTNRVAPGYFKTLGIPIEQGRDFDEQDTASKEKLAILNVSAAHTLFPHGAVGQLLREDKDAYRVIGVVGDAKYASLKDPAPRTMFQSAIEGQEMAANGMMAGTIWNLVVSARTDLGPVIAAVREFIRSSKQDVSIEQAMPLNEQINGSLFMERLLAILTSFFAALAAALVAIGLYGVLGYMVTRRTSEIGVRLALGAPTQQIWWMILSQAFVVIATGTLVGVAGGVACQKLVSAMLFEAKPTDPAMIAATVGFLVALGLLAGFFPARRASRLDPMVALRQE